MELFWPRGHENVTLDDLQAAMGGITPPSFYHVFGSKEELFRKAYCCHQLRVQMPAFIYAIDGGVYAAGTVHAHHGAHGDGGDAAAVRRAAGAHGG